MNLGQKTNLSLTIFIIVILVLVVFSVYPLMKNIQKGAQELVLQRNTFAELKTKIQNLEKFEETYADYQANLEKISKLFINSSEPINFIEFLEVEAQNSNISVDILPLASNETKYDFWPSMNFQLTLKGSFSDFMGFFEKLESSQFLIEMINLDISTSLTTKETMASLLIKVYTK